MMGQRLHVEHVLMLDSGILLQLSTLQGFLCVFKMAVILSIMVVVPYPTKPAVECHENDGYFTAIATCMG